MRPFSPRFPSLCAACPVPGASAPGLFLFLFPALFLSSGALPISIRNEADVAVENGRRHLESAQRDDGFWTMDGRDTVLPAFAFLGVSSGEESFGAAGSAPSALAAAARAALSRLVLIAQPRKGTTVQEGSAACFQSPLLSMKADAPEPSLNVPPPMRGDAPEGQGGVFLVEDALIVAATLSLYGTNAFSPSSRVVGSALGASAKGLLASARIRLLRLDPASCPPTSAWLARCALDLIPGRPEQPADWAPLFSPRPLPPLGAAPASPAAHTTCEATPLLGCAIKGYARIRHGAGASSPAALLAHLRWLRAHAGDLLGEETPPTPSPSPPHGGGQNKEEAPPSLRGNASDSLPPPPSQRGNAPEGQGGVSPEDLYFVAVFLDAAPPVLVATAGISAAWRLRIAQHLIATARSDGQSGAVWADADGEPSLRQTLFAVATLAALGE